jgi:hypothetical protein
MYVCVYLRVQIEKGQTNLPQTWHSYALKPRKDFRKVKISKSIPGSNPSESGFPSSENRKNGTKTKIVCFGEDIIGKESTTPKDLSWVRVLVEMFSVAQKLNTIKQRRQDQSLLQ